MVNFRLAEDRLAAVRTQAARRRVSVSAYVRLCVEAGIERDEAAARDDIAWQREVPAAVRELIGLGGFWREVSDTLRHFCGADEPQTDADSLR